MLLHLGTTKRYGPPKVTTTSMGTLAPVGNPEFNKYLKNKLQTTSFSVRRKPPAKTVPSIYHRHAKLGFKYWCEPDYEPPKAGQHKKVTTCHHFKDFCHFLQRIRSSWEQKEPFLDLEFPVHSQKAPHNTTPQVCHCTMLFCVPNVHWKWCLLHPPSSVSPWSVETLQMQLRHIS